MMISTHKSVKIHILGNKVKNCQEGNHTNQHEHQLFSFSSTVCQVGWHQHQNQRKQQDQHQHKNQLYYQQFSYSAFHPRFAKLVGINIRISVSSKISISASQPVKAPDQMTKHLNYYYQNKQTSLLTVITAILQQKQQNLTNQVIIH